MFLSIRITGFMMALAASGLAFSQPAALATEAQAKQVAEKLVAAVAADKFIAALRELAVVPEAELASSEARLSQDLKDMKRVQGPAVGFELISDVALGAKVRRLQYLVHHDRMPVRWNFMIYNGDKGWRVNSFAYTPDIQEFIR